MTSKWDWVIWYLNIGHAAGGFEAALAATVGLRLHLLYHPLGSGSLEVGWLMVFQGIVTKDDVQRHLSQKKNNV